MATIPRGEWLCKACVVGDDQASCVLCPVKGGALKRVRPGNSSWAHLCCALWIPEVRVGNADKMEPITNIDAIPVSLLLESQEKLLLPSKERKKDSKNPNFCGTWSWGGGLLF